MVGAYCSTLATRTYECRITISMKSNYSIQLFNGDQIAEDDWSQGFACLTREFMSTAALEVSSSVNIYS